MSTGLLAGASVGPSCASSSRTRCELDKLQFLNFLSGGGGGKGVFMVVTAVTLPWDGAFLGRSGLGGLLGGGTCFLRLPWSRECHWAGGCLCCGVSWQGVPRLQCHRHSKPGNPLARYLPRSWKRAGPWCCRTLRWGKECPGLS